MTEEQRERKRQRERDYYRRNAEKKKEMNRRWHQANPDKQREYSLRHRKNKPTAKRLYDDAKIRASLRGLEFTIEAEDVEVPDVCPIFNVTMVENTNTAPSLDRIDSSKGYVKGNIAVISRRANVIKNDGTASEHMAIAAYMQGLGVE